MIYLDSAATSLYKPETVQAAVLEAMHRYASPGRGSHAPAMEAAECCYECREKLARLFHAAGPEQVVFTLNATHALNLAIHTLVRPGGRVLISGYEHNSVTRPLHALGAHLTVLATPLFDPAAFLEDAQKQIAAVDAVICTHVSNVFGYVLPVQELAALCRSYGKPFVLDAAQSAGVLEVDMQRLGADFVAMPGHKGLMGPQGTGVLLCRDSALPLLYGGSGSDSARQSMPEYLPDRLEAGTQNVCGIAGLSAGVDYLLQTGTASVRARERALLEKLAGALSGLEGLRLFYSPDSAQQCGVLSVLPERTDCEHFAALLSEQGIAVRSGLHCAPLAHRTARTAETGTVRFSFSPFNTAGHIQRAAACCAAILKNF